jgi:hypothetical protein
MVQQGSPGPEAGSASNPSELIDFTINHPLYKGMGQPLAALKIFRLAASDFAGIGRQSGLFSNRCHPMREGASRGRW